MKLNKLLQAVAFLGLITGLTQCSSAEIGDSKDVSQDKIYQKYSISYNEPETNASLTCQYRFAGKDGTTLVLSEPSTVSLDGNVLKVDSTKGMGAFYGTSKPVSGFYGKHSITFSDINNKKYTNGFTFSSFKLTNIPATADKTKPLKIGFESLALGKDDYITLSSVNTDSSFSVMYNTSDTSKYITIPVSQLKRQKDQFIEFSADLYREIPLQQTTSEGGKISLNYGVKPVKIKLK